MAILRGPFTQSDKPGSVLYMFWCPGCKTNHLYLTSRRDGGPTWTFNGNLQKPTFRASLLHPKPPNPVLCHLFVTDGIIEFCGDCTHELKGQKVPMVDHYNEV